MSQRDDDVLPEEESQNLSAYSGLSKLLQRHFDDYEGDGIAGGKASLHDRELAFRMGNADGGRQYVNVDFNFGKQSGKSTSYQAQNEEADSSSFALARKLKTLAKSLKSEGYGIRAQGSDQARDEAYDKMLTHKNVGMKQEGKHLYFRSGGAVPHFDDGGSPSQTPAKEKIDPNIVYSNDEGFYFNRIGESKGIYADASNEEMEGVHLYQNTPVFWKMQNYLRGTGEKANWLSKAWHNSTTGSQVRRAVAGVDSLQQRSSLPEMTVHRAMVIPEAGENNKQIEQLPGKTITDDGFVSTSKNPKAIENFMVDADRVRGEIRIPEGSKGINLHPNETGLKTKWDKEEEVMLPRGSQFQVESVQQDPDHRWRVKMDLLSKGNADQEDQEDDEPHFAKGGKTPAAPKSTWEKVKDTITGSSLFKKAKKAAQIGGAALSIGMAAMGGVPDASTFGHHASDHGRQTHQENITAEWARKRQKENEDHEQDLAEEGAQGGPPRFRDGGSVPHYGGGGSLDEFLTVGNTAAKVAGSSGLAKPGKLASTGFSIAKFLTKVPGVDPMALAMSALSMFGGDESGFKKAEMPKPNAVAESTVNMFGRLRPRELDEREGSRPNSGQVSGPPEFRHGGEVQHFDTGGDTPSIPALFGTKRPEFPIPPPLWKREYMEMYPKDAVQAARKEIENLYPGGSRGLNKMAEAVGEYVYDWSLSSKNVGKRVLGNIADRSEGDVDLDKALASTRKATDAARSYEPDYPIPVAAPADYQEALKSTPRRFNTGGDTPTAIMGMSSAMHKADGGNVPVSDEPPKEGETPIRTTPGEFYVAPEQASRFKPVLEAINDGKLGKPKHSSAPSSPAAMSGGGEIPQFPGVGSDEDEVPMNVRPNSFIVKKSETEKFKPQLQQIANGEEPHFKHGGGIEPSESKTDAEKQPSQPHHQAPQEPLDIKLANWKERLATATNDEERKRAETEIKKIEESMLPPPSALDYEGGDEPSSADDGSSPSPAEISYRTEDSAPPPMATHAPPIRSEPSKVSRGQSPYSRRTPLVKIAINEALRKIFPSLYDEDGNQKDPFASSDKESSQLKGTIDESPPMQFGGSPSLPGPFGLNEDNGLFGKNDVGGLTDNDELISVMRELVAEMRELRKELNSEKPGLKSDGSFVPGGQNQHTQQSQQIGPTSQRRKIGGFGETPITPGQMAASRFRQGG